MSDAPVPSRCHDVCPLAHLPDLDKYGIFLTKNCVGPGSPTYGEPLEPTAVIERGGIAREVGKYTLVDVDGSHLGVVNTTNGEVTCRNSGAIASIEAAINRSEG